MENFSCQFAEHLTIRTDVSGITNAFSKIYSFKKSGDISAVETLSNMPSSADLFYQSGEGGDLEDHQQPSFT